MTTTKYQPFPVRPSLGKSIEKRSGSSKESRLLCHKSIVLPKRKSKFVRKDCSDVRGLRVFLQTALVIVGICFAVYPSLIVETSRSSNSARRRACCLHAIKVFKALTVT